MRLSVAGFIRKYTVRIMNDFFKIGLIVKPQGIKGEVKVQPLTDDPARFLKLKSVIIDGENYRVLGVKVGAEAVIAALSGVTDRNAAELMRGKFMCVKREDAVELKENTFFIANIIGCALLTDDGEKKGVITDVTNAKTDIFTVRCEDGRILRFPFLKDLLVKADVENKTVTVKKSRLSEVGCYED